MIRIRQERHFGCIEIQRLDAAGAAAGETSSGGDSGDDFGRVHIQCDAAGGAAAGQRSAGGDAGDGSAVPGNFWPDAKVTRPVKLAVPRTSSVEAGVAVPMPTLTALVPVPPRISALLSLTVGIGAECGCVGQSEMRRVGSGLKAESGIRRAGGVVAERGLADGGVVVAGGVLD